MSGYFPLTKKLNIVTYDVSRKIKNEDDKSHNIVILSEICCPSFANKSTL